MLRERCHSAAWIVFSDAFKPRQWRKRLPAEHYADMYVDHHQYQIFAWLDKLLPARVQVWRAKFLLPRKLQAMAKRHPLIVGEWSLAMRSEKLRHVHSEKRRRLAKVYYQDQVAAFDCTAAWFYWTYKTENGGLWSFRDMVDSKIITR